MNGIFRSLLSCIEHPSLVWYIARAGKPSILSYSICRAIQGLGCDYRTIIDVGGNVGQFANAADFWFRGARILSFEPTPELHAPFKRNTRRLQRVELFPLAVGREKGIVKLGLFEDSQRNSVLLPSFGEASRFQAVPSVPLDDFVKDQSLERPLLLKIDVQGAERDVLAGGDTFLRREVDAVLIEVSLGKESYVGEADFNELNGLLQNLGFRIRGFVGFHYESDGSAFQADVLYCRGTNEDVCHMS